MVVFFLFSADFFVFFLLSVSRPHLHSALWILHDWQLWGGQGGGLKLPSLRSHWLLLLRENAHWESEGKKRERDRREGREGEQQSSTVQSLSRERRRRRKREEEEEEEWAHLTEGFSCRTKTTTSEGGEEKKKSGSEVGGRRDQRLRRRKEGFSPSLFSSRSATGETLLFFCPPRRLVPLFLLHLHPLCLCPSLHHPSIFSRGWSWRLRRKLTSVLGCSLSLCLHVWVCSLAPAFLILLSSSFLFFFWWMFWMWERAAGAADAFPPSRSFICSPGILLRRRRIRTPVWTEPGGLESCSVTEEEEDRCGLDLFWLNVWAGCLQLCERTHTPTVRSVCVCVCVRRWDVNRKLNLTRLWQRN